MREFKILVCCIAFLLSSVVYGDISIASFNIKHYGWNNDKDIIAVAEIISRFDLVAIQELMDEEELIALDRILEEKTGQKWEYLNSHPVGRSSYKEQYGFIWNDEVSYVGGAVVYIDDGDIFAREPMSLQFKSNNTGFEFALASVHVVFGDSVRDREGEIKRLASYWDWLGEVYPNTPRILAGDFNLPPNHDYFHRLTQKAMPLITSGKTTLSKTNNRYASLYDNLFVDEGAFNITEKGIFKYPQILGLTHKQAGDRVSDHVPVYMVLGNASVDFSSPESIKNSMPEPVLKACIDINTSSLEELKELPNIGEVRAQDIIDGRPWKNIDTLTRIKGIGTGTVNKINEDDRICD